MTGTKTGTLHREHLMSHYNFLEGSAHNPSFGKPLWILGRENINRWIRGDQVLVWILPRDQWKQPASKIVEEETLTQNDNPDTDRAETIETEEERRALVNEQMLSGHNVMHQIPTAKKSQGAITEGKPQPTAFFVGVIKRNWRYYAGHLDRSSVSTIHNRSQRNVFLIPMDKWIPKICPHTPQASELSRKRIVRL